MKTNPTHFIEVVKYPDGETPALFPLKIKHLDWSLGVTRRMNVKTIAVFKIYPKAKPAK